MITISGISKAFHGKPLYEEVSLQINRGDRIALIGPNGAGKSTLFGMILGSIEPDEGSIIIERGATIGFLPQESAPVGEETVMQIATASLDGSPEADQSMSYYYEPQAKRILSGLGFKQEEFDRPAREFSGGWVMRAHLARLLVQEPDLLMLDEPTNHLDLETLIWFKNYLEYYPNSIVLISHDRDFMNGLVDTIADVRNGGLKRYTGNYEEYLEQKAAFEANQLTAFESQQKEIERLQRFADRFRAKASKASQAQSKLKQIDRMEKIEAPVGSEKTIKFRFPQPTRSGQKVITLKDIHQAYGEKVVYSGMDFETERDQRIVLVGPNGAGKSTLLKILAGVLPFQSGIRNLGHNTQCGYFSQHRAETMNSKNTVLEEAQSITKPVPEQTARTVLGSFLFRNDDVFKPVGVLSGGEKTRLALVKMLLDPPNLLLMDEPTTHLDIPSIDALVGALEQYTGTLVFISHDVYFIRAISNHVVHVNEGKLTQYPGGYQYYLDKTAAVSERHAITAGGNGASDKKAVVEAPEASGLSRKEQKRIDAQKRQTLAKERRAKDQEIKAVEEQIAALEKQQEKITEDLENPDIYKEAGKAIHLNRELSTVTDGLENLTQQWERLGQELEVIQGKSPAADDSPE
ncbi:MAG: ABC-F family ATP-binding cassette domain-containing protein [Verrucomicrobiota bacterium]|nr:ABC-F family ATP-binding cassette domain-containing protein [Verrucomicrobiota bacterium]